MHLIGNKLSVGAREESLYIVYKYLPGGVRFVGKIKRFYPVLIFGAVHLERHGRVYTISNLCRDEDLDSGVETVYTGCPIS